VVVRVGDQLESPVNIAAAAAGLRRTIAGWVPNFSVVAPVLAATDLLATLPAPAMAGTLRPFGLDSRRVPFAIEPIPHVMLWSAARAKDPEIAWLRNRLRPLAKSRFTSLAD
jgi:DNA-binding transcriptional LysR family regulator